MKFTKFNSNKALEAAMEIKDKKDADQYLMEYISYIQSEIDKCTDRIHDNAEEIAKSNLGYFAGYYSNETRERVEKLFCCSHPIFGSIKENGIPTNEQAFEMGERYGTKILRKKKIIEINKNENR
jgi:hypothetical protein